MQRFAFVHIFFALQKVQHVALAKCHRTKPIVHLAQYHLIFENIPLIAHLGGKTKYLRKLFSTFNTPQSIQ